jgi:phosphate starvation-inducible PhoH-like protein|tara:strand:+ start:387 stop:1076 length:690 start_codon:yes stop_codon:yes gene_type:complete
MPSKLEFNQLSQKIRFKERKFKFTQNQVDFLKTALDRETKLMFLAGPAGTAKTYMAVYSALQAVMTSGLEKDVLYVRSIAESSQRGLGSLPGSIDEKFAVFAGPFYDKLDEMLSTSDIKLLREKKMFECMPVNFVRGANWNDRVVIIDEAQNFTYNELMTVLTRIGEDSKIIICGDMMQSDIRDSGFNQIFEAFDDEESKQRGIHCTRFGVEDIKRSEILKYIVSKLED